MLGTWLGNSNPVAKSSPPLPATKDPIAKPRALLLNLPGKPMAVLAFIAIAVYLAGWLALPLYPDEVALRFVSARALTDGFSTPGLFPICADNLRTVPSLLRPAALLFGGFDQWFGWAGLRTLPLLLLLAISGLLLARSIKGPGALLLCGAFIGISGASLMMLRPEWFALLQLFACMATFGIASRAHTPIVAASITVLHVLAVSISLLVHPQGLLLLPLSVLSLARLYRHALPAFLLLSLLGLMAWQSWGLWQFRCDADPTLRSMVVKHQSSVIPLLDPQEPLARTYERTKRYLRHATYQRDKWDPDYLPRATHWLQRATLPVIMGLVALNILAVALLLAVGLRQLWNNHAKAPLRWPAWRDDPWSLITGSAVLLIAYAVIDIGGTFYRALFTNFMAAMLLTYSYPHITQRRFQQALGWLGVVAFVACLGSAMLNTRYVMPALHNGFSGMSTPVNSDWNAIARDVATLKQKCNVRDGQRGIVADDVTYQALRHHPGLMDFIYLFTDEMILRARYDEATPAERRAKVRASGASAVVVRCRSLEQFKLPQTARSGELCCFEP